MCACVVACTCLSLCACVFVLVYISFTPPLPPLQVVAKYTNPRIIHDGREGVHKEFLREVEAMLCASTHPNIIDLHAVLFERELMLLEYCSAGSLRDLIKDHPEKLTHPLALSLLMDVASGVYPSCNSTQRCFGLFGRVPASVEAVRLLR